MKLYNVITIFDTYVVAESGVAAREALLAAIAAGDAKPSEVTATETRREDAIRAKERDERPFVAADVSDADFETCKGKTTVQLYQRLYTKRG